MTEQQAIARGERVGKAMRPFLRTMEEIAGLQSINVIGLENLLSLKGQVFVGTSNHTAPSEGWARHGFIPLPVDAFVVSHIVRSHLDTEITHVAQYSSLKPSDAEDDNTRLMRRVGFKQAGYVPVNKDPQASSRQVLQELLQGAGEVVQKGKPLFIFSENMRHPDHALANPIPTGAVALSRKYDIPVLPMYIHGATGWVRRDNWWKVWDKSSPITVVIGKPFYPDKTKGGEDLVQELRTLQQIADPKRPENLAA